MASNQTPAINPSVLPGSSSTTIPGRDQPPQASTTSGAASTHMSSSLLTHQAPPPTLIAASGTPATNPAAQSTRSAPPSSSQQPPPIPANPPGTVYDPPQLRDAAAKTLRPAGRDIGVSGAARDLPGSAQSASGSTGQKQRYTSQETGALKIELDAATKARKKRDKAIDLRFDEFMTWINETRTEMTRLHGVIADQKSELDKLLPVVQTLTKSVNAFKSLMGQGNKVTLPRDEVDVARRDGIRETIKKAILMMSGATDEGELVGFLPTNPDEGVHPAYLPEADGAPGGQALRWDFEGSFKSSYNVEETKGLYKFMANNTVAIQEALGPAWPIDKIPVRENEWVKVYEEITARQFKRLVVKYREVQAAEWQADGRVGMAKKLEELRRAKAEAWEKGEVPGIDLEEMAIDNDPEVIKLQGTLQAGDQEFLADPSKGRANNRSKCDVRAAAIYARLKIHYPEKEEYLCMASPFCQPAFYHIRAPNGIKWYEPDHKSMYTTKFLELSNKLANTSIGKSKGTPLGTKAPLDLPEGQDVPQGEHIFPSEAKDVATGPQRWMFTEEWRAAHPTLAQALVPVDEPTSPAHVMELDWYAAQPLIVQAGGVNRINRERSLLPAPGRPRLGRGKRTSTEAGHDADDSPARNTRHRASSPSTPTPVSRSQPPVVQPRTYEIPGSGKRSRQPPRTVPSTTSTAARAVLDDPQVPARPPPRSRTGHGRTRSSMSVGEGDPFAGTVFADSGPDSARVMPGHQQSVLYGLPVPSGSHSSAAQTLGPAFQEQHRAQYNLGGPIVPRTDSTQPATNIAIGHYPPTYGYGYPGQAPYGYGMPPPHSYQQPHAGPSRAPWNPTQGAVPGPSQFAQLMSSEPTRYSHVLDDVEEDADA